jgi:two-component system cell cycle sensor histidine kinase PleC
MNGEDAVWQNEARARERSAKLALDQTALALRSLALNHWIMPIFTAIICVMFARWIEPARLAAWFFAVILSTVPLAVVSNMFQRHKPDVLHWRRWVAAAAGSYFVFTAIWSSLGFVLWAPNDNLNHMVVLLALATTIAGSSALISASKPMACVAFVTCGTALVVTPLQQGGMIYNGISLLAIFFTFYLVFMSRHMHAAARDMLLLRNDKDDLIVALAYAKAESDEARAHAEAANQAKSQFLANMSHELRTPLNAILGFSEIIYTNAVHGDTARDHDYAGLINKSGHHLLELINDVLDLAKIEAGGLILREAELDLSRVIDEAHALMAPKAAAGGCRLAKEVGALLPHLFADERAVKQVLLNLLSNAVKFTLAGGTVTSFARVEDDGRIAVGVRDTGVGIAKEDQVLVFQKFGQGRHDVVTADQGTGLGLPIVKGLVEAHGGSIALESEFGTGTTITARFPASRARPVTLRAAS